VGGAPTADDAPVFRDGDDVIEVSDDGALHPCRRSGFNKRATAVRKESVPDSN
jgi:hypothetical protein